VSPSRTIVVALDAMGGDSGPVTTVPAALRALELYPDLSIKLFGKEAEIKTELASLSTKRFRAYDRSRLEVIDAPEVVEMDDQPAMALRNKKRSSMRLAVNSIKEGLAQAMVSAGNTGALMAVSKFVLKTLPGVSRPAILTTIPSEKGHFYMLDLGANVDCSAEQLYEFAVMGSVVCTLVEGIESPRVGLLNIGEEVIKGNEQVKAANSLLLESQSLNYVGYVEGDTVFKDVADVVVCDGFVGNVALKSIEGVAKLISGFVKAAVKNSLGLKAAALVGLPFVGPLKERLNPSQYNGAALVGLKGTVIKSHGSADESGLFKALVVAYEQARLSVPDLIAKQFESKL